MKKAATLIMVLLLACATYVWAQTSVQDTADVVLTVEEAITLDIVEAQLTGTVYIGETGTLDLAYSLDYANNHTTTGLMIRITGYGTANSAEWDNYVTTHGFTTENTNGEPNFNTPELVTTILQPAVNEGGQIASNIPPGQTGTASMKIVIDKGNWLTVVSDTAGTYQGSIAIGGFQV